MKNKQLFIFKANIFTPTCSPQRIWVTTGIDSFFTWIQAHLLGHSLRQLLRFFFGWAVSEDLAVNCTRRAVVHCIVEEVWVISACPWIGANKYWEGNSFRLFVSHALWVTNSQIIQNFFHLSLQKNECNLKLERVIFRIISLFAPLTRPCSCFLESWHLTDLSWL